MAHLKIIIVGAGIGGPAAAIGLAQSGHDVTMYERATTTGGVGYAFRITPNSDRCLKHLGIDAEAGGACAANSGRMMGVDGSLIKEMKENEDEEQAKKATSVFAYRPQLHRQLIDRAVECGVKLKTGVKVASVDVEKTELVLEGGERVHADLIIAADGVHSIVRPEIVDTEKFSPKSSTGHNAFRFMVSTEHVQKDPAMSSVFTDDARLVTWAGNGKRILVYPVDYGKSYNITCTHLQKLSDGDTGEDEEADISYNQKASAETVYDIYSEFDPVAVRLLKMADPNGFRIWKLVDMDEIPRWSKGHVVMLGDACHPVSPFGFSGASMSIEDAVTLATLLPAGTTADQILGRLQLYEYIRRPRVGRVRDTARLIAGGKDDDKVFTGEYMKYLAEYDAYQETKRAMEQHLNTQ